MSIRFHITLLLLTALLLSGCSATKHCPPTPRAKFEPSDTVRPAHMHHRP